jgi:hypothetical protein
MPCGVRGPCTPASKDAEGWHTDGIATPAGLAGIRVVKDDSDWKEACAQYVKEGGEWPSSEDDDPYRPAIEKAYAGLPGGYVLVNDRLASDGPMRILGREKENKDQYTIAFFESGRVAMEAFSAFREHFGMC